MIAAFSPRSLAARYRGWVLLAALVLLALRTVVPTGFMPTVGERGFGITLCGAMAGVAVGAHQATNEEPDHAPGDKMAKPCVFAALGLAATVAVDPPLITPVQRLIPVSDFTQGATTSPIRERFLRPPLRGPPLS